MLQLTDALRKAAIAELDRLELPCLPSKESKREFALVALLRSEGVIDDSVIDSAFEKAVIFTAKKGVALALAPQNRERQVGVDHYVVHPEYLAYAIQKGAIPQETLAALHWEGETPESFCRQYARPDLIAELKQKMLSPVISEAAQVSKGDSYVDRECYEPGHR